MYEAMEERCQDTTDKTGCAPPRPCDAPTRADKPHGDPPISTLFSPIASHFTICCRCGGYWVSAIFFYSFYVLGFMVMFNLFVAVILDNLTIAEADSSHPLSPSAFGQVSARAACGRSVWPSHAPSVIKRRFGKCSTRTCTS